MGLTSEIYLTKSYVTSDEWLELIKTISNYNGFLRKWKIIVTNNKKISPTLLEEKNEFVNYLAKKNDLTLKYNYFKKSN